MGFKKGSRKAKLAGQKAAKTRARNKRLGTKVRKPSRKTTKRKGHVPKGFGKFTVNKEKLIAKLEAQKKRSLKPTEVVSLTWDVIRGHKKAR